MAKKKKQVSYNDLLMDQSPINSPNLMGFYTPDGIRRLDSYYGKLIRTLPNKEFADKLRKEIKNNPHLHEDIKENLLDNLRAHRKYITPESQRLWDENEAKKPKAGKKVKINTGRNKGVIATVTRDEEGPMGFLISVTSDDPAFWPSLHSLETREDRLEAWQVEVVEG